MRHPVFIFIGSLTLFVAMGAFSLPQAPLAEQESVEFGLAETSPQGSAGGFAIPASGNSYSCTMYGMPTSMNQGETFNLFYGPALSTGYSVSRNGTSLGAATSSPWADSSSSALPPGTYTYSLYGNSDLYGNHCTQWGTVYGGGGEGGSYSYDICVTQAPFTDDYSCSANLTILPPPPDLVSSGLALQNGSTSIRTGDFVKLTARVTNDSPTLAGAFKDIFKWFDGVIWTTFSEVPHTGGLNPNQYKDDISSSIAFPAGSISVSHCVDSDNQVAELVEGDANCSQRDYAVSDASTTISVSCTPSPSPANTGQLVTWSAASTGGTGSVSYQWTGSDSLSGSGTSITKIYVSAGTKTASVKAIDSLGISSGWQSCTSLTVNSVAAPTAQLDGRIIGGGTGWIADSVALPTGQQLELKWSSTNATSCSGVYFDTADTTAGTSQNVFEPTGLQKRIYLLTCTGPGGTGTNTFIANPDSGVDLPTLTVDPARIRRGDTTHVKGDLKGNTGCVVTGKNIDPSNTDGDSNADTRTVPDSPSTFDLTTGSILGETTYTIDCPTGDDSDTVKIIPFWVHF